MIAFGQMQILLVQKIDTCCYVAFFMSFLVEDPAFFVSQLAGDLMYKTVLCLERGTLRFLRFYHQCPIKTLPAQAYGYDIENLWISLCGL